jgi:hypothetical protein
MAISVRSIMLLAIVLLAILASGPLYARAKQAHSRSPVEASYCPAPPVVC